MSPCEILPPYTWLWCYHKVKFFLKATSVWSETKRLVLTWMFQSDVLCDLHMKMLPNCLKFGRQLGIKIVIRAWSVWMLGLIVNPIITVQFFIVEEDLPRLKNKLIQLSHQNILWKSHCYTNDLLIIFLHINKIEVAKDPHECSQCTWLFLLKMLLSLFQNMRRRD